MIYYHMFLYKISNFVDNFTVKSVITQCLKNTTINMFILNSMQISDLKWENKTKSNYTCLIYQTHSDLLWRKRCINN